MNTLKKCDLCPRNCLVNRYEKVGYCRAKAKLKIALASIHMWEEPVISGRDGSGTIFFSHCNLGCIFCQNYKIRNGYGKEITIKRFSEICLELQSRGANNINLVTPTHYVPLIRKGLIQAKNRGLIIPIVYNTSSYENEATIESMKGLVDVYLADLKYYDDSYAKKYSNCNNYFEVATKAIGKMVEQVGSPIIHNGLMKRGVIVRVLLLPGLLEDAKKIIKYLYETYHDNIYISIMNQYTIIRKLEYSELNDKVDEKEYDEIINYAYDLGIRNAFIQEGSSQSDSFIPSFKGDMII